MKTRALFLLGCLVMGCGSDSGKEESSDCFYEATKLDDEDARAQDFDRTPREIFAPAVGELNGELASRQLALTLEPDYAQLEALYDRGGDTAACPPNLRVEVAAQLTLTDDAGESVAATGTGVLELRHGELLTSLSFDTDGSEGLGAIAAAEAKKSLRSARLEGWLSNLDSSSVESKWRWTVSEDCADSKSCPGARELDWGEASLTKD